MIVLDCIHYHLISFLSHEESVVFINKYAAIITNYENMGPISDNIFIILKRIVLVLGLIHLLAFLLWWDATLMLMIAQVSHALFGQQITDIKGIA